MFKKRKVIKRSIRRFTADAAKKLKDTLVVEEPFTLVWQSADGKSERLTSTMRTPGDDLSLATGMLFSEGLIQGRQELKQMSFCTGGGVNELNRLKASLLLPASEAETRLSHRPSASLPQSACGLCAVDDLSSPDNLVRWAQTRYRGRPSETDHKTLKAALKLLSRQCPVFSHTGASHACVVVDSQGKELAVAEDVGRHNACDKAIGKLILEQTTSLEFQLPPDSGILFSSRLSFELAAKAAAAGAAWMASVGAPTHLAVELARRCGIPLYGFVSEERFNMYTDSDPMNLTPMEPTSELFFDGFLKYRTYHLAVAQQEFEGGFVHGPGHHIAAVAGLVFDEKLMPHAILKSGDTRLSRAERSESYVMDGFIAGRMDKAGARSSKIALAELAEEVGGEVVGDTFRPLGQVVSPTMPLESTEGDNYFMAAVELSGKPLGDGGGMEVADLIGPKIVTPDQLFDALQKGLVSEVGRTQTLFSRAFDAIGYLPQLDLYVHDHPALVERFDTLGLDPLEDLRSQLTGSPLPEPAPGGGSTLESRINEVVVHRREVIETGPQSRMVCATTSHAVRDEDGLTVLENEFANQYLQLDYDRVKLVTFYRDPEQGPMVRMPEAPRPALAFAPGNPPVMRRDVVDVAVSREKTLEAQLPPDAFLLGRGGGASAGQSDLYYHFAAREVSHLEPEQLESYYPLSEAIRLCRCGEGDAQTEALLRRLSRYLEWIPNLSLSVSQARALLS